MIVHVSTQPKLVPLSLLEFGEGFIFASPASTDDDSYFIRSEPLKNDGQLYGTRLSDGKTIRFSGDAEVTPVALKVVAA